MVVDLTDNAFLSYTLDVMITSLVHNSGSDTFVDGGVGGVAQVDNAG